MTVEYYKMIRTQIQLVRVDLIELNCKRMDQEPPDGSGVNISIRRETNIVDSDKAEIYLYVNVGFDNHEGPFEFDVKYKGYCLAVDGGIDASHLQQFAQDQIVPLLLPYARECIASTIARMNWPVFTIPTMDVLSSLEFNNDTQGRE